MSIKIEIRDVYFVCLEPAFGREIGGYKSRPVVVVSIDKISNKTRLVTVVPGTSYILENDYPSIVSVEVTNDNGLYKTTQFQCHQIRAIDQGRIRGKRNGKLSEDDFDRIKRSVAYCLGFPLPDYGSQEKAVIS